MRLGEFDINSLKRGAYHLFKVMRGSTLLWERDSITIGENGYMSGYNKDNYGEMSNPFVKGEEVQSLLGNYSTNIVFLTFVSGGRVLGSDRFEIIVDDISTIVTWDDGDNRYDVTNAAFADFLRDQRGNKLPIKFIVLDVETPCMTGYDAPFGLVAASAEYSASYPAWKGMNCSAVNGGDSWTTPVWEQTDPNLPDPAAGELWFRWYLTDDDLNAGMSMMFPTEITITPRAGMDAGWYSDNNPYRLRIAGINSDMSEEVLVDEWFDDTWTGGTARTIDLTGLATEVKRGFTVYILGTRNYETGNNLHTAWAWVQMKGSYN